MLLLKDAHRRILNKMTEQAQNAIKRITSMYFIYKSMADFSHKTPHDSNRTDVAASDYERQGQLCDESQEENSKLRQRLNDVSEKKIYQDTQKHFLEI